jgi:hypothetical protein
MTAIKDVLNNTHKRKFEKSILIKKIIYLPTKGINKVKHSY